MTLLGILLVVVLLCLVLFTAWHYFSVFPELRRKIVHACEEYLWPQRWLLLAYLPFFGKKWYEAVLKAFTPSIEMLPQVEAPSTEVLVPSSTWILFQEQLNRMSGDHHGTTYHFLIEGKIYQFYQGQRSPEFGDCVPVLLPCLHPLRENKRLARMRHDRTQWILEDHDEELIPLLRETNNNGVTNLILCNHYDQSDRAFRLQSGDRFILAGTEFEIIRFPKLGIYLVKPNTDTDPILIQQLPFSIDNLPPSGVRLNRPAGIDILKVEINKQGCLLTSNNNVWVYRIAQEEIYHTQSCYLQVGDWFSFSNDANERLELNIVI
jgi:hypothetical protein